MGLHEIDMDDLEWSREDSAALVLAVCLGGIGVCLVGLAGWGIFKFFCQ